MHLVGIGILWAAALLPTSGGEDEAALERIVRDACRRIGVERIPAAGACRERADGRHVDVTQVTFPGTPGRSMWSVGGEREGRLRFAPIGMRRPLIEAGRECPDCGAILPEIPPAATLPAAPDVKTFEIEPATLTFRSSGRGGEAIGSLRIRRRPAAASPPVESLRIIETSEGSMLHRRFELPVPVTSEWRTLEFAWDLHSPADPEQGSMCLLSPRGLVTILPIVFEEAAGPVIDLPPVVSFASGSESAPVEVSVLGAPGEAVVDVRWKHPPECLEWVSAREVSRGVLVRLRQSPVAARRHRCRPLELNCYVGDDPIPYERAVAIRHPASSADEPPRPRGSLCLPGETVYLLEGKLDSTVLAFPERMPGFIDHWFAAGWRLGGEFQAPLEVGEAVVSLPGNGGERRVPLVVSEDPVRHLERWHRVNRRDG